MDDEEPIITPWTAGKPRFTLLDFPIPEDTMDRTNESPPRSLPVQPNCSGCTINGATQLGEGRTVDAATHPSRPASYPDASQGGGPSGGLNYGSSSR